MSDVDLVIRGGRVVFPDGVVQADAAASGGVTTMIPTLLNREDASVSFLDYFPWARRAVEERSLIDAAFGAVTGTSKQIEELPRMARECGICSYKFYMVHAEKMSIIHNLKARDIEAGRDDLEAWTDARPDLAESDADFALVDLERERVVTPEYMQSAADWGLYDGWSVKGWPVTTIVRGEVVMRDGRVGSPSHGTYVARHPA